jgi:hypothetical protein
MIYIVIAWLVQDLLQVMLMGLCLVPEIFLLVLLFLALLPSSERKYDERMFIVIAFVGGLLWDLRWTNLPGLTAAINGLLLASAMLVWYKMPAQGRSVTLFCGLAGALQVLSGLIHCFFWTVASGVAVRLFVVQQLLGIPLIIFVTFIYWKVWEKHV